MTSARLQAFEQKYVPQINECLDTELTGAANQPLLNQAMQYSVDAGGKRLRPLLTLAVVEALGQTVTSVELQVACAVELVHTYSLIHDDLPAMDNDDLRRGKPTNHKQFGEDIAILAGDGLQTLAFEWLADAAIPAAMKIVLVKQLAVAAGPRGMVAGQVEDVSTTGTTISMLQLQALHRRKTGALIAYAVVAGGVLAGANAAQQQLLQQYGAAFGLAFQIYDDILDETASASELGKTPGKDDVEGKNTYPRLVGMDAAKKALTDSVQVAKRSCQQLANLDVDVTVLEALLSYFDGSQEEQK